MVVSQGLLIMFNEIEMSSLVIVCMALFIISFELSIGPISFIHAQETNIDVIVAFSQNVLYLSMLVVNFITPLLVQNLGVRGTFSFYCACNILSVVHQLIFLKETSYKLGPDGEKIKLNDREKKELYMPDEFKDKI